MSDHDEPTEPFAPVPPVAPAPEPADVVTEGDAEAPDEPSPKQSLFAAVNGRRVAIALVAIALVWLGVWAYSSDSAATSSSATTVTTAPRVTVPTGPGQGKGHKPPKGATTLAPPPNLPRTPQAYATALIADWLRHDRPNALRVATLKTVNHLFARRPVASERLTAQGCAAAGSVTSCTWSNEKRVIVLQVRNPTGSTPVRVVGATVRRL